jgi:hypothetical protein
MVRIGFLDDFFGFGKIVKVGDNVIDGTVGVGRNADDYAGTGKIADDFADTGVGSGFKYTGPGADAAETAAANIAKRNAQEAAEKAMKNADDEAASSAIDAGKQTDEAVNSKSLTLAKVATVGGIAVSAIALKSYFEKNKKKYNIISIDDVSDDNDIKTQITIQSGDKFSIHDSVEIKDTNCVPDITGKYSIQKIITNEKYIIKTSNKITTKGDKGELKLLTTFENVFASTLKDVFNQAKDTTGFGLEKIFELLCDFFGVSPETMKIIIYVIIGIIVVSIIYKIFK